MGKKTKAKKDKEKRPEQTTNIGIDFDREALRRRLKCAEQNPPDQLPRMHRLGDALIAESRAASVLEETAGQVLRHGARRGYFGPIKSQSSSLSLMSYKLISLEFGPEIVNGLQFMTILNLAKNNLYDSAALFSALSQLGNLAHLDVSENFLNGDLDVSAGGLHALETINLASNNITALPASVGSWARVRSVNISFNSLTALPKECNCWTELTHLNIRRNHIASLEHVGAAGEAESESLLASWTRLETLTAGLNRFKALHAAIGSCLLLRELDLSGRKKDDPHGSKDCGIVELPESLKLCTILQTLQLGDNKLTSLSTGLFGCGQEEDGRGEYTGLGELRVLHLHNNQLSELPDDLCTLKKLQRLSVSGNRLARLPENLGDCSSLEALYLNANKQLKQLPDSICRLSRLRELCANRCGISALPRDLLQLTQLDVLDLRPDLKKPEKTKCKLDEGVYHRLESGESAQTDGETKQRVAHRPDLPQGCWIAGVKTTKTKKSK